MIIKNEHFRNLYKKPIIIKNEEFSKEIARSLLLDSVLEDDLTSDELKEKFESIEVDEKINSTLAIPYIDHTAGMSFHILATAILDYDKVNIIKRDDFSIMINSRKDKVNNSEFEYLDNLQTNNDFDIKEYSRSIEIANSYFINDDVETLRFSEVLDNSRHEDFPDDVGVLFFKKDCQVEKMWVRYENIVEEPFIEGVLLNSPYQDFGIDVNDKVKFFPYKDDDGEIILICNLDS